MDNYWGTDVSSFGMRWLNNSPISETVGAATMPPLQTRWWGAVYPHRLYSKRPGRYTIAHVVCAMFRAALPPWERILEDSCVKYM